MGESGAAESASPSHHHHRDGEDHRGGDDGKARADAADATAQPPLPTTAAVVAGDAPGSAPRPSFASSLRVQITSPTSSATAARRTLHASQGSPVTPGKSATRRLGAVAATDLQQASTPLSTPAERIAAAIDNTASEASDTHRPWGDEEVRRLCRALSSIDPASHGLVEFYLKVTDRVPGRSVNEVVSKHVEMRRAGTAPTFVPIASPRLQRGSKRPLEQGSADQRAPESPSKRSAASPRRWSGSSPGFRRPSPIRPAVPGGRVARVLFPDTPPGHDDKGVGLPPPQISVASLLAGVEAQCQQLQDVCAWMRASARNLEAGTPSDNAALLSYCRHALGACAGWLDSLTYASASAQQQQQQQQQNQPASPAKHQAMFDRTLGPDGQPARFPWHNSAMSSMLAAASPPSLTQDVMPANSPMWSPLSGHSMPRASPVLQSLSSSPAPAISPLSAILRTRSVLAPGVAQMTLPTALSNGCADASEVATATPASPAAPVTPTRSVASPPSMMHQGVQSMQFDQHPGNPVMSPGSCSSGSRPIPIPGVMPPSPAGYPSPLLMRTFPHSSMAAAASIAAPVVTAVATPPPTRAATATPQDELARMKLDSPAPPPANDMTRERSH